MEDLHHEHQVESAKVSIEHEAPMLSHTAEDCVTDGNKTRDSPPLAYIESENESLSLAPNIKFSREEDQGEEKSLSLSLSNSRIETRTEAEVDACTPNVTETSNTFFASTVTHETDDESLILASNKENKDEFEVERKSYLEVSPEEISSLSSNPTSFIEEERIADSKPTKVESLRVAKRVESEAVMTSQIGNVTSQIGKDEESKPVPPEPEAIVMIEEERSLTNPASFVDVDDVIKSEINLETDLKKFPEKVESKIFKPESIKSISEIVKVDLPVKKFDSSVKLSTSVEGGKKAELQRVQDRPKSVSPLSKIEDSIQLGNNNIRCQFHQQFMSSFFCMKFFCVAFMSLQFEFIIFWCKEIGTKAARKMLVKLTTVEIHHLPENVAAVPTGANFTDFFNDIQIS